MSKNGTQLAFIILAVIVFLASLPIIFFTMIDSLFHPSSIIPLLGILGVISGLFYLGLSSTFAHDDKDKKD